MVLVRRIYLQYTGLKWSLHKCNVILYPKLYFLLDRASREYLYKYNRVPDFLAVA
jgi:hypothetical protein